MRTWRVSFSLIFLFTIWPHLEELNFFPLGVISTWQTNSISSIFFLNSMVLFTSFKYFSRLSRKLNKKEIFSNQVVRPICPLKFFSMFSFRGKLEVRYVKWCPRCLESRKKPLHTWLMVFLAHLQKQMSSKSAISTQYYCSTWMPRSNPRDDLCRPLPS